MRAIFFVSLVSVFLLGCTFKHEYKRVTSLCKSLEGDTSLLRMTGYVVLNSKGEILLTRGGEDWDTRQIQIIPCGEGEINDWILRCYDSHITMGSYGDVDSLSPVMWMTVEGKYLSRDTGLTYPQFIVNFAALPENGKALQAIKVENSKLLFRHGIGRR